MLGIPQRKVEKKTEAAEGRKSTKEERGAGKEQRGKDRVTAREKTEKKRRLSAKSRGNDAMSAPRMPSIKGLILVTYAEASRAAFIEVRDREQRPVLNSLLLCLHTNIM
jgi:hypothetical protein